MSPVYGCSYWGKGGRVFVPKKGSGEGKQREGGGRAFINNYRFVTHLLLLANTKSIHADELIGSNFKFRAFKFKSTKNGTITKVSFIVNIHKTP